MRRSSAGLAELMRAGALWMSCWAREKGDQAQEKGISLCPHPVGVGILLAASTEPPPNSEQLHLTEGSPFLGDVEGAVLGVQPLKRTQGWLKDAGASTEMCARALASALPTFPCAW